MLKILCQCPGSGNHSSALEWLGQVSGRRGRSRAMISGNKLRGRTLIIILLALATSRGVSQKQSQQPWNGALRIQKEVRHELLLLPYLNVFNNLSFSVDGDEVTLTGQVTRPGMKADAEKAV